MTALTAGTPPGRRRWVEPELTRHESLMALTQQQMELAPGRPLMPGNRPMPGGPSHNIVGSGQCYFQC